MKFKVKLSELYKIIEEEYQLVNGNSSAWGLPGNWAAKVTPAQENEDLEESMPRAGAAIEAEDRLVNAALDFQKVAGDARAARTLREMADSIERESGTQPNLSEMNRSGAVVEAEDRLVNAILDYQKVAGDAQAARTLREMADSIERGYMEEPESGHSQDLNESAMIDIAVLGYLWDNLGVPGSLDKFINSTRGADKKIDDWFKNNMRNPLVRGLYKALMLTGSPGDNYRHDKKWEKEQQQAKGLEESVKKYVVRFLNGKNK